jgi:hypothetical protein
VHRHTGCLHVESKRFSCGRREEKYQGRQNDALDPKTPKMGFGYENALQIRKYCTNPSKLIRKGGKEITEQRARLHKHAFKLWQQRFVIPLRPWQDAICENEEGDRTRCRQAKRCHSRSAASKNLKSASIIHRTPYVVMVKAQFSSQVLCFVFLIKI